MILRVMTAGALSHTQVPLQVEIMAHICLTRSTWADLSGSCLGPSLWVSLLQKSVLLVQHRLNHLSKLCRDLFRRITTSTTVPTHTRLCNRSTIFVEAQPFALINDFLRELCSSEG